MNASGYHGKALSKDLATVAGLSPEQLCLVDLCYLWSLCLRELDSHVNYDGLISFRELRSHLPNALDVKSQFLH